MMGWSLIYFIETTGPRDGEERMAERPNAKEHVDRFRAAMMDANGDCSEATVADLFEDLHEQLEFEQSIEAVKAGNTRLGSLIIRDMGRSFMGILPNEWYSFDHTVEFARGGLAAC